MIQTQCKQCFLSSDASHSPPFGEIHDGRYWKVLHAYPSSMLGWLIVQAKPHRTALHQVNLDEHLELGLILDGACKAVHELTGCEKEHAVSVGDGMYGSHVTFHLIPRQQDSPAEYDDFSQLFACLSPNEQTCLSRSVVDDFCLKCSQLLGL